MKNRIREIREAKGLSLENLAEKVETDRSQIRRLESGERRLTVQWMVRIAKALDVSPSDLLPADAPKDESPIHKVESLVKHQVALLNDGIAGGASGPSLQVGYRKAKEALAKLLSGQPEEIGRQAFSVVMELLEFEEKIENIILKQAMEGSNQSIPIYVVYNNENQKDRLRIVTQKYPPHSLVGIPESYGIYMKGNHMEPRYKAGWIIFAHPFKPPIAGRDVILYLKHGLILICELALEDDEKVVVRQINPIHELSFQKSGIEKMHLVVACDQEG